MSPAPPPVPKRGTRKRKAAALVKVDEYGDVASESGDDISRGRSNSFDSTVDSVESVPYEKSPAAKSSRLTRREEDEAATSSRPNVVVMETRNRQRPVRTANK